MTNLVTMPKTELEKALYESLTGLYDALCAWEAFDAGPKEEDSVLWRDLQKARDKAGDVLADVEQAKLRLDKENANADTN